MRIVHRPLLEEQPRAALIDQVVGARGTAVMSLVGAVSCGMLLWVRLAQSLHWLKTSGQARLDQRAQTLALDGRPSPSGGTHLPPFSRLIVPYRGSKPGFGRFSVSSPRLYHGIASRQVSGGVRADKPLVRLRVDVNMPM